MTGISGLLPEWPRTAQGGGSSQNGSLSTSLTGAAQVWQREMERQQQRTWFQPPLSILDGEPASRMVANKPTGMAAQASVPVACVRQSATSEAIAPEHQSMLERGEVRRSAQTAYGRDASSAVRRENRGTGESQKEAIAPVSRSLRTNWMQAPAAGAGSAAEAICNIDAAIESIAYTPNKAGSASARSAIDYASSGVQPPLRVSCGWQDGQFTVWIGHDRGQGDAAAKLAQAIDQWLITHKLAPAGFVINGEPRRRDRSVQDVANAAGASSLDRLPSRIAQVEHPQAFADFILRRNT